MKQSLLVNIATLGPVGYIKGSGTIASLIALPMVLLIQSYQPTQFFHLIFLIGCTIFALYCVYHAVRSFPGDHDPGAIVIDELIGCWVTFFGIHGSALNCIIGFLIFRLFDIYKLFGIKFLERWKAPWGILADDIAAGIIANICIRVVAVLFG